MTVDTKWGDHLCFSVGGKMFAIFDVGPAPYAAFKVDDVEFEVLTRRPGIIPAPYAARFSWVRVEDVSRLSARAAQRLLTRAHALVLEKLPARTQRAIVEASTPVTTPPRDRPLQGSSRPRPRASSRTA